MCQRSTFGPSIDRSAGSSVTAATITTSTASEAETATPYMYGRPVSASPRTAITTVAPAMITLRPAVVTASTIASWVSLPRASAARKRVITSSA
jgi:hypothetical protein